MLDELAPSRPSPSAATPQTADVAKSPPPAIEEGEGRRVKFLALYYTHGDNWTQQRYADFFSVNKSTISRWLAEVRGKAGETHQRNAVSKQDATGQDDAADFYRGKSPERRKAPDVRGVQHEAPSGRGADVS